MKAFNLATGVSAFWLTLNLILSLVDARNLAATSGDSYWSSVKGDGSNFTSNGVVRTYYIRAEEVMWNYAPRGKNLITGKAFDDVANTYVQNGPSRIGSSYLKCLYRGYTDVTYTTRKPSPPTDEPLGLQGPVIRAQVGDTIRVFYRNTCRFPNSVHTHGVRYLKPSEGAPYNDGTFGAAKKDDIVPTGGSVVYTWYVPEQTGPGPNDGSSIMWMYHSHTDEVADTYAGLMGSMVITARGMANPDATPKDVDREVFELWSVMDENKSPYIEHNLKTLAKAPNGVDLLENDEFGESNLMHSINGYVFGNSKMLTLCNGERVRWYSMALGTEVDLHTPHWHGNVITVGGHRRDVIDLLPATMVAADMVPYDDGIWLHHCHVNDHIRAGMLTRYTVQQC